MSDTRVSVEEKTLPKAMGVFSRCRNEELLTKSCYKAAKGEKTQLESSKLFVMVTALLPLK